MDFWFTGCKGAVCNWQESLHAEAIRISGAILPLYSLPFPSILIFWFGREVYVPVFTAVHLSSIFFTMGMGAEHPLFQHYGFNGCPQLLVIGPDGHVVIQLLPTDLKSLVEMISGASRVSNSQKSYVANK